MIRIQHDVDCLSIDDENFMCNCTGGDAAFNREHEEDLLIARASVPSAADLILQARARGWVQEAAAYH